MARTDSRSLNLTFGALADPTRRELLRLLEGGPTTASALALRFRMSLPGMLKHLKVLSNAGLTEWRPHPSDGRAKTCVLRPQGLAEAEAWVQSSRADWQKRFAAMERILAREARKGER